MKELSNTPPSESSEQCLDRVYANLVLLQEVTDICVGDDAVDRMYGFSKRAIVALMDFKKARAEETRSTPSETMRMPAPQEKRAETAPGAKNSADTYREPVGAGSATPSAGVLLKEPWLPVRRAALEWLARQDRNEVDRAYVAMEAIAMAQLALLEHPEGFVQSATKRGSK